MQLASLGMTKSRIFAIRSRWKYVFLLLFAAVILWILMGYALYAICYFQSKLIAGGPGALSMFVLSMLMGTGFTFVAAWVTHKKRTGKT